MGKDAEALKHFGQAEACFKQASYMVPHRLYPIYLLAKMYFESGQSEKGRDMARQVIQKEPKVMSDAVKRNESRIGRKTETIGKRENLLKSTVRIEKEGKSEGDCKVLIYLQLIILSQYFKEKI